jgi:hypothetical protein
MNHLNVNLFADSLPRGPCPFCEHLPSSYLYTSFGFFKKKGDVELLMKQIENRDFLDFL